MASKDIYRICLRLFGVYFLAEYVISNFSILFYGSFVGNTFGEIIGAVISIGVVLLIVNLLLFKTDKVIKVLRLEQDHQDARINADNLHDYHLYKIAIAFVGLLLLTGSITTLFLQLVYLIEMNIPNQMQPDHYERAKFYSESLAYSAVAVTLGLVITKNATRIARWFTDKTKNTK
jgi:L-lactate permease